MAERMLVIGESSGGKRLADYELVATPNGWVKIGDIKVGDYVYDEQGKITKVINVYKNEEQIYRLYLKNNMYIDCCKDHLWKVGVNNHNVDKFVVRTTQEIFNSNNPNRYFLPITEPVEYPKKDLKIPPYLLGALLGDGCLSQFPTLYFSNFEDDVVDSVNKSLISKYEDLIFKKNEYTQCQYTLQYTNEDNMAFARANHLEKVLIKHLRELGLEGVKSRTKFIPEIYLRTSIEDRFELLKGLFDTDGSVSEKGSLRFTTYSKQLAEDFIDLASGLGIRVSLAKKYRKDKQFKTIEEPTIEYTISIQTHLKIWSSEKHQSRMETFRVRKTDRVNFDDRVRIDRIEILDDIVPMTCLEVDSPYHTFLTKNHIVTHNSSSLRNLSPSDTVIIKCFNKRLPFKNGDNKFKVYTPNDYTELVSAVVDILEKDKHKKVKNIIIDDIIYFMSDEFMKTINVKGFEKFSNMASGLYGAFKDIPDIVLADRPDILVTFLTHATINEMGNISIRTIGKLIDEKVKLEGMFEMVLLARLNEDGQYVFQVHNTNNSKSVVKTPMGMFETDEIDNDLAYVIKKRNEYYGIEDTSKEK